MATVTKPIALDETLHTTENPSRNIADVLAEELKGIADNILPPNASQIAYDNTGSGLNATNVQDAIDEVISSQADVIADTLSDLTENKTAVVTDGVADFETIDGSLVKSLVVEIEQSQSGSGTPSPSNIRPITGWTQEDVLVVGKNLAEYDNENNPNRGAFNYSSDTAESLIATRVSAGGAFFAQFRAYVIAGKTYTFSYGKNTLNGVELPTTNIYIYSDRLWGTVIKGNWNVSKTGSEWVSTYTGEIIIGFYNSTSVGTEIKLEKFQLELGSTATTYEPYKGKTYTTTFGQTVYGGTLDVLTGELTIDSAMAILTGDNVHSISAGSSVDADGGKRININITGVKYVQGTATAIADRLAWNNSIYLGGTNSISVTDDGRLVIRFAGASTVEDAQTALNNTNIQVCYEFATPTTIQLTPQTVKTLVGENHISASTGDVLECKYSMLINGDDLEMLLS